MEEDSDSNPNDNSKKISTLENKKPKKTLVTFSKLNKYFLIPFLTPVFIMFTYYFMRLIEKEMKNPLFFITIYDQLGILAAGLLYFFYKDDKLVKNGKETQKEIRFNSFEYIYNENERDININKFRFLIVILSLLMAAYEICDGFYLDKNVLDLNLFFFIFTPIFCKVILKENIYKHHYFSLVIGITGIIIASIPVCFEMSKDDIIPNIVNLIIAATYSLFYVIIKYIIKEYYISVFLINLKVSLLSIIFELFGFTIYSLIKYHDFSYFKDSFEFYNIESIGKIIIFFILYFLFLAISQALIFLLILYFSPLLLITTLIINPFLYWIISAISDGEVMPNIILYPIGYFMAVFASLIYNEIIIFNFWGLGDNTKKFIEKRLLDEGSDIKKMEIELRSGENDIDSKNSNDD